MSRIDNLIAQRCPDGVEYRALGEVGTFARGNGLQKKDLTDTGIGAIHYGQVFTHYGTSATETKSFADPATSRGLRRAKTGDLVIATTSENDEDVCKAVAWLGSDAIVVSGDAYVYSHSLHPLYASYYFQSDQFQRQKRRFISGTKVRRVSGKDLERISIPVPPLVVQREIAAILEKVEALQGELQGELEAELHARQLQYAHYRHALLDFPDGVRWATLGEVLEPKFGTRITKMNDAGSIYPVYGGGGVSFRTNDFNRQDDYVISRFAISAECVRHVNGRFWLLDSGFTFDVVDEQLDKDFVAQFLFSKQDEIYSCSSQGAQKNIRIDQFKAIRLPIPSKDRQREIVALLAEFEALAVDLTTGLLAEIEARRQQYEYYRDRLLSFEEKAV